MFLGLWRKTMTLLIISFHAEEAARDTVVRRVPVCLKVSSQGRSRPVVRVDLLSIPQDSNILAIGCTSPSLLP